MVQCHLSAMIINYQKDLLKGKEHEKFHVFLTSVSIVEI